MTESVSSYRGSRRSWRSFAVLGAGTGVRHGRALRLNSLKSNREMHRVYSAPGLFSLKT